MNRFILLILLTVVSCVTSNNTNKTFNKYLTKTELEILKEEKIIDKIHTSYRKNGQIHFTGPLKVRLVNEELQFTKHGLWKGYYETGELFSEAIINSKGQIVHEKIYEKDGTLSAEIIGMMKLQKVNW